MRRRDGGKRQQLDWKQRCCQRRPRREPGPGSRAGGVLGAAGRGARPRSSSGRDSGERGAARADRRGGGVWGKVLDPRRRGQAARGAGAGGPGGGEAPGGGGEAAGRSRGRSAALPTPPRSRSSRDPGRTHSGGGSVLAPAAGGASVARSVPAAPLRRVPRPEHQRQRPHFRFPCHSGKWLPEVPPHPTGPRGGSPLSTLPLSLGRSDGRPRPGRSPLCSVSGPLWTVDCALGPLGFPPAASLHPVLMSPLCRDDIRDHVA